jgi:hypothetical protein
LAKIVVVRQPSLQFKEDCVEQEDSGQETPPCPRSIRLHHTRIRRKISLRISENKLPLHRLLIIPLKDRLCSSKGDRAMGFLVEESVVEETIE